MAKKEGTYAEAMAEIEKILARLRNEEMDVDSLAAEVKRATELIASCKARLRKAEADVNKILEYSRCMRKILRQPLLNAAVAVCGVIDKSDPTPTLPRRGRWRTLRRVGTKNR